MISGMAKRKSDYPRDLEDGYKLFCRSTPEVFEVLARVVSRVEMDRGIKFKGDVRPKKAAVMNALILYFDSLTADQQVEAVRVGMGRLNEILARPIPGSGAGKPAEGPAGGARREGFDLAGGGKVGKATYPSTSGPSPGKSAKKTREA